MLYQSLAKPSFSSIPIPSSNPRCLNSYSLTVIRSKSVDLEKKTGSEPSPPSKLFESASLSSASPYPGGLGPYTGRDPTVKKPEWLRQRAPQGERFRQVKESLSKLNLNTVCEEAQCPNIGEVK